MGTMTTLNLNEMTARQNRALLVQLAHSLRARMERRAVRQALLRLDDRMLKDIGLNRASVMSDLF
jgi:uncharacterized protein YjiS (DUF1127 family)